MDFFLFLSFISAHFVSFIFQSFCCTIREKKNDFSDAIKVISRIQMCYVHPFIYLILFRFKNQIQLLKCVVCNIEFLSGDVYIHLLCITKYKPELMREKNAYNWGMKHSVFFILLFFHYLFSLFVCAMPLVIIVMIFISLLLYKKKKHFVGSSFEFSLSLKQKKNNVTCVAYVYLHKNMCTLEFERQ